MSFRELIILLLGLAIVAVILRGLYVAIQARKGQIKLAIDKNIPQDVDLDALELSELPGGGARVVQRDASNDNLDPIEQANARAESMALDRDAEAIPVLMDSVTLSQNELDLGDEADSIANDYEDEYDNDNSTEEAEFAEDEEGWEEDITRQQPSIGIESVAPDYDDSALSASDEEQLEEEYEAQHGEEYDEGSEPETAATDDILLDYEAGENDGLASVQPDYPDQAHDEADVEEVEETESYSENYDEEYEDETSDTESDDYVDDYEVHEESNSSRTEPSFDPTLGDGLDDFSMTAGERIGYQAAPSPEPEQAVQNSSSNFDDDESDMPVKRTSLFTALRNKISQTITFRSAQDNADDVDELSDAELAAFENEDIESALNVEDEYSAPEERFEDTEYQQAGEAGPNDVDGFGNDPMQQDFVQEESDLEYETPTSVPATDIRQHQPASQPTEVKQQAASGQPSEVLVLNVMAREGRSFHGDALLRAVITQGLQFGEMNIFHYRFKNHSKGPVIFSLANILNPGTFDLNNMSDFSTIGVSLFLALPAAGSNYEAFEQMLDIAQQLCASLDGELKDDHRNVMTAQTIEHYRQRVRDFELRQLKAAGARG